MELKTFKYFFKENLNPFQARLAGLDSLEMGLVKKGEVPFADASPEIQKRLIDNIKIEDFIRSVDPNTYRWKEPIIVFNELTPEQQKKVIDKIGIISLVNKQAIPQIHLSRELLQQYIVAAQIPLNINKTNYTQEEQRDILVNLKKVPTIIKVIALKTAGKITTLAIGRGRLATQVPMYIFDYDFVKNNRILSSVTQANLDTLQKKYRFKYDKVYVTIIDGSERYSFFITGLSAKGRPFIYSRKETASAAAGQTKIYSDKGNLLASNLMRDDDGAPDLKYLGL